MTLDLYRAVLDRMETESDLIAQAQAEAESDALHARLSRK